MKISRKIKIFLAVGIISLTSMILFYYFLKTEIVSSPYPKITSKTRVNRQNLESRPGDNGLKDMDRRDGLQRKIDVLQAKIDELGDFRREFQERFTELAQDFRILENKLNKIRSETPEGYSNNLKTVINLYELRRLEEIGLDFSPILDILGELVLDNPKLYVLLNELRNLGKHLVSNEELKAVLQKEYNKLSPNFTVEEKGKGKLKRILTSNVRILKAEDLRNSENFMWEVDNLISNRRYAELKQLLENRFSTNPADLANSALTNSADSISSTDSANHINSSAVFSETLVLLQNRIDFENLLVKILTVVCE